MDSNLTDLYKVVIIGCGQLGSRHLQGLLKVDFPIAIDVVDASESSLSVAKSRAEEILTTVTDIRYLTSIQEVEENIDLCIIATGSNIRLQIIQQLTQSKKVKNLVLEKVLFQSLEEYETADALFREHQINCWVNCPRPLFDIYKELKSKIAEDEIVTYTAIGGDWSLACNAIHLIDHMAFLTSNNNFQYDHNGITSIIESKRKGFIEFAGTFIGRQTNGSEMILHSRLGSNAPLRLQILTASYMWVIDEGSGLITERAKENNWKEETSAIKIPFQSELTNVFAAQILLDNRCDLTSYSNSMTLHMGMLNSFLDFYNTKTNSNTLVCPIT